MEHSQNLSSTGRKAAPESANEESGWTSYFEDFSKGMEQSYCSSLVSDAASCAAWKLSHQNHHNIVSCSSHRNSSNLPKKLCFKKTRSKQILEDDPLEDTASSPINSPKGKGFKSENHLELKTDEHEINFNGKKANNIDCTDLKKRDLCLVPLSMLANYYG
ncbi:hypothetical protein Lal_00009881 [Lupinus albus]|nr:hypothetical protein Lal_00009881 [Lupinus albus]